MATFKTIAIAVRDILLNTSGVTDITNKIYPFAAPQLPTLPFILYHTPEDVPYDDIDGSAGLFRARIQLDAYSDNPGQVWDLAEEIRKALQGYTGISKTVIIKGVRLENQIDFYENEIDNFRVASTFNIWYKRTIIPVPA